MLEEELRREEEGTPMAVNIRAANAGDREACIELLQDLSGVTGEWLSSSAGDAFDGLLDGARGQILVAEEDGELLGLASVTYNLAMRFGVEYCQLEEVVVEPSARGRQVGRRLMEATLAQARQRGCAEIGAYLTDAAELSRGFYEKFGLESIGTTMRHSLT